MRGSGAFTFFVFLFVRVVVCVCVVVCVVVCGVVWVAEKSKRGVFGCVWLLWQAAFEAERKDRMEREGRIQSNLSKHEHDTMVHFEEERVRGFCLHEYMYVCLCFFGWGATFPPL